jgi:HEAT repeat protein
MLGEQSSIAPLERALHDTNEEVRAAVAEALGELGENASIAPLVVALQDPVVLQKEGRSCTLEPILLIKRNPLNGHFHPIQMASFPS